MFTSAPSMNEIIFITYNNIIKCPSLFILNKLLKDKSYYDAWKDYINYSKIENKSDEELMEMIYYSTKQNILEYLAIKEFDYDGSLKTFIETYDDMFDSLDELPINISMNMMFKRNFLKKLYIYTEEYSKNIGKDIFNIYGNNSNVIYCYGDFKNTIMKIHETDDITTYMLNDVLMINDLIEIDKISNRIVMVVDSGWNLVKNENRLFPTLKIQNIDKLCVEKVFNLQTFRPFNLKKSNM